MSEARTPDSVLDEDDHTRRRRDTDCANAIATALDDRFGHVPLHLRYALADTAIVAARAATEPTQRYLRTFDALSAADRDRLTIWTFADVTVRDPGWLDRPDPPEPDWEAGERP